MIRRAVVAIALGLAASSAAQGQSPATEAAPGAPLERHSVEDSLGRQITYYLSRPSQPAPLLLMIQGSGCQPVIQGEGSGTFSTLFNFLPFAQEGRFAVMAVEKPFAAAGRNGPAGTANGCSAEFNADFTAERWLTALQASLADARRLPWVDGGRTLVLGMSEGAVMASLLAGSDDRITDVIAISGSGTTQLFDMLAAAYDRCFDRSACLAEVERQAREIAANPDSPTNFAWGQPYRRWSSFFRAEPAEALLRSRARVYLAIGTDDRSVPPLSQELIAARLIGAGRDVTVRRVPEAGHGLVPSGAQDFREVDREYRAALDWFWQGGQD